MATGQGKCSKKRRCSGSTFSSNSSSTDTLPASTSSVNVREMAARTGQETQHSTLALL